VRDDDAAPALGKTQLLDNARVDEVRATLEATLVSDGMHDIKIERVAGAATPTFRARAVCIRNTVRGRSMPCVKWQLVVLEPQAQWTVSAVLQAGGSTLDDGAREAVFASFKRI